MCIRDRVKPSASAIEVSVAVPEAVEVEPVMDATLSVPVIAPVASVYAPSAPVRVRAVVSTLSKTVLPKEALAPVLSALIVTLATSVTVKDDPEAI